MGYVLAVLGFTLLSVLGYWGVASISEWLTPAGTTAHATGLRVLAWAGLVVLALGVWWGTPTPAQGWMIAAVGVWNGATAVSMTLHSELYDGRFWAVTAVGLGLAAAASMIPAPTLRRLLLTLGWFYGWGSVFSGLASLSIGWPAVNLVGEERFSRWVSWVGVNGDTFGALNGLTPGRVYAGLTGGLLLVYTVRTLAGGGLRWWWWMSCPGLLLTVMWALSRTGGVIIALGLVASLIPWERLRAGWLLGAIFAVILSPLLLSGWLANQDVSDGSTSWRFDLWQQYLHKPGLWSPFGIGPQPASNMYADHAHQQLLESQATGGWLGLLGVCAFVVLGALAAQRSAIWDNRAALAVLFGMAAIFEVDVVVFTNRYDVVNNAFVLIVVVLVAAAASPPHSGLLRETPDTVNT